MGCHLCWIGNGAFPHHRFGFDPFGEFAEASRFCGEVEVLGQGLRPRLQALERFADLYQTGQIPEYHSIVDTILNWSKEILACTTADIPTDPSKG